MAKTTDPNAAKARKQKLILAAAGGVFLVLALIQGPKLWKQLNPPAPEAAAAVEATVVDTSATAATTTVAAGAVTTTSTASGATTIAAVTVKARPPASAGQLASFTLFEMKDPFEPQVAENTGTADAGAGSTDVAKPAAITGGGSGTPTATGGSTPPKTKVPAPTYATIQVNGNADQLQVKEAFPEKDKMFVLVSLKKTSGKIGVKGGSFANGDLVTLTLGKSVTLVNTVTGTRYVIKLVYTGDQPETIESFSPEQPAASTPSGAPTATSGAPTASGNG
jgi:hypothetical protein